MYSDIQYTPPASVEEAMNRKAILGVEIQDICRQLGDRNRLVDGRRMTDQEYWTWHRAAVGAKSCKEKEIVRLKQFILQHDNRKRQQDNFKNLVLRALWSIMDRLGVDAELAEELRQEIEK